MAAMNAPLRPVPITAHNGPWPLCDVLSSRAAEADALALHRAGELMARAGLSAARLAMALWPRSRSVTVWAGPGNNGGDGLVAARHLHECGWRVEVLLVAPVEQPPADAAAALRDARAAGVPVHLWTGATTAEGDVAIDALLGLGSARAPQGLLARAIAALNASAAPVLAIDLPSGLHPETGRLLGAEAVRAQATLSLLTLKPGCFTHEGRDHAGAVWLDDLGHPAGAGTALLSGPPPTTRRAHATHKGRYGDVAVVGGATGMTGAAQLAAGAALAAGAGRVYLSPLDAGVVASARPELMTRIDWWRQPPATLAASTVVAGCGGGEAIRAALPALLGHAGRLVLDADALNAISQDATLHALLRARRRPTLLTPHPLEAARLLGCTAAEVQNDRIATAQRLAIQTDAAVLLKGSGTVIATPAGTPCINPTGNAALATASQATCWPGGSRASGPAARTPPPARSPRAPRGSMAKSPTALRRSRQAAHCARPSSSNGWPARLSPRPDQRRVRGLGCGRCGPGLRERRLSGVLATAPRCAFVADLATRSAAWTAFSSSLALPGRAAPGVRSPRVSRRSPSPSRTMRKSILRPSRSTRLTCTRTRVPTP
jgi:hydroxyethylthiazole kinase-like uncharacterized protein yjeF